VRARCNARVVGTTLWSLGRHDPHPVPRRRRRAQSRCNTLLCRSHACKDFDMQVLSVRHSFRCREQLAAEIPKPAPNLCSATDFSGKSLGPQYPLGCTHVVIEWFSPCQGQSSAWCRSGQKQGSCATAGWIAAGMPACACQHIKLTYFMAMHLNLPGCKHAYVEAPQ
jgi:hypothetical protein